MPQESLLIENVQLVDGTGSPSRPAALLIKNGKIDRVYDQSKPDGKVSAKRTIDGEGRVAAPGFIDSHCHGEPLDEPDFHNFLAMGVTSILLGQDGKSPHQGPLDEWLDKVSELQTGVNVLTLAGHGTLRYAAGIGDRRRPSHLQLASLETIIAGAMDQGAFGLSTGLEYVPGIYSDRRELAAVARPIGEHGGIIMSHMRSEDDDAIDEALDELIEQGIGGMARVHVSHIKVSRGKGARRARQILQRIEAARNSGIKITADIYPYTASCTTIGILFPKFAQQPANYQEIVRTRRTELAAELQRKVEYRNGPAAALLVSEPWTGMTLLEAAEKAGKSYIDFLIDDVGVDGADGAYFVMDDDLQAELMTDPCVMISSDGSPEMRHPRGYGAFARVIRHFVQERGLFSLEEAVHKMTGLPAETLGLDKHDRGLIREGFWADVLLFHPENVRDTATYEDPHQLAEGMDYVFVNGKLVREAGEFTGLRAGEGIKNMITYRRLRSETAGNC